MSTAARLSSVRVNELRSVAVRPAQAARVAPASVCALGRREVASLIAAATILVSGSANAVEKIAITAGSKEFIAGVRSQDQAREVELPEKQRFAIESVDANGAKARITKAKVDLKTVGASIDKQYWTEAKERLRGAAYYLRYDLNVLADAKGTTKAAKKDAKAAAKSVVKAFEEVDFEIRRKDLPAAKAAFSEAQATLESVLKTLA